MWRLAALGLALLASASALAPPSAVPPTNFHVHVGAGKLGLSLIVPAVASVGARFAVLDTPADPSWTEVLARRASGDDRPLRVVVNGEEACALNVADEGSGALAIQDLPALVITDDERTLGAIVAKADTMSCSLGPFMEPVITRLLGLAPRSPPRAIYCCENDHDAVARLAAAVGDRVTVVDCMVDRITAKRRVDARAALVDVDAEAWPGTIVPLDPAVNRAYAPPFGAASGADIIAPATAAEAKYLSDRKLALVNGMHTTLAFLTLRDAGVIAPGDLALLKPTSAPDAEAAEIWHWALARCCVLIHDHGLDLVKAVHGLDDDAAAFDELAGYARAALGRFDGADDTVARVLGGGVAKRWQGRLAITESGLARALAYDTTGAVDAFLARENVDGRALQNTVAALVEATQEICQVDYDTDDGRPKDPKGCAPEHPDGWQPQLAV